MLRFKGLVRQSSEVIFVDSPPNLEVDDCRMSKGGCVGAQHDTTVVSGETMV